MKGLMVVVSDTMPESLGLNVQSYTLSLIMATLARRSVRRILEEETLAAATSQCASTVNILLTIEANS